MDAAERDERSSGEVERLGQEECWRLLGESQLGRLAVRDGEAVDLFPVNHGVDAGRLVIRTGWGTKLNAMTVHHAVAFEVDGQQDDTVWSVVVKGSARVPERGTELQHLNQLGLSSWSPATKSVFVVIEPTEVSGRRFRRQVEQDPAWTPR